MGNGNVLVVSGKMRRRERKEREIRMIEGKRSDSPLIMCLDSLNVQHMLVPRLYPFTMKMSGDYMVFLWLCRISNLYF